MKPVDHVMPTVPANWVRRVDEKRRPRDPKQRNPRQDQPGHEQPGHDPKHPHGQDPDGRTHTIDDLA